MQNIQDNDKRTGTNKRTDTDNPTADKMPQKEKPAHSAISETRKQTTKGTWGDREATNGTGVAGGGSE